MEARKAKRVRGKRGNKNAHNEALSKKRKYEHESHHAESRAKDERFSKFESLPVEIIEMIFDFSRSFAMLGVSRRIRYIVNRESLREKITMAQFYDVGFFRSTDDPCENREDWKRDYSGPSMDERVRQWKTMVGHPGFKFSWFDRHLRDWMLNSIKGVIKRWWKRHGDEGQSDERLTSTLDQVERSFPTQILAQPSISTRNHPICIMLAAKSHQHLVEPLRQKILSRKTRVMTMRPNGNVDFPRNIKVLAIHSDLVRCTPKYKGLDAIINCFSGFEYMFGISPLDSLYHTDYAWTQFMLPRALCRSPFTQSKGNMLKCILDFTREHAWPGYTERRWRADYTHPISSDLTAGFEEALRAGCLPAIHCLGPPNAYTLRGVTLDSRQPDLPWVGRCFTDEPIVFDQFLTQTNADPWTYLNGFCFPPEDVYMSSVRNYYPHRVRPEARAEERHLQACLDRMSLDPNVYGNALDGLLLSMQSESSSDKVLHVSSQFFDNFYACVQAEKGEFWRGRLEKIYRCALEATEEPWQKGLSR